MARKKAIVRNSRGGYVPATWITPAKSGLMSRRKRPAKRKGLMGMGELPSLFLASWILQFMSGLVRSLLISIKIEDKWLPIAIPAVIYWIADSGKFDFPGLKQVALVSIAREAGVSLGLSRAGYGADQGYRLQGAYGQQTINDMPPRTPTETLRQLKAAMGPRMPEVNMNRSNNGVYQI